MLLFVGVLTSANRIPRTSMIVVSLSFVTYHATVMYGRAKLL